MIKKILAIFAWSMVFQTICLCKAEPCGRISDYIYDKDSSDVIVANRSAGKQIAITFDDGPCREYTPVILDILAEYKVSATFFVTGKNAESHPDLLRRIYNEGHEIGNHTYSHPQLKKLTPEQVNDEISRTQAIVKDITGECPVLFRPPGGYLSNNIVDKITSNNCITVLWSWRQDTMDWKCPSVDTVVDTVLSNIKDGDIILFHDYICGKSPTPEALRIIIPTLISHGYRFVTVSELMNI